MEFNQKAITDYFSKHKILIADSNASSRTGIAKALGELGARNHNMTLVDSYVWAEQVIEQSKPTMIISDFNLGTVGAFDLFSHPKYSTVPMQDRLSVVVTSNTSQAAVASAAEGDVDLYIAKPYNLQNFWSSLKNAAALKLQPTDYLKTIEDGKKYLASADLSRAIEFFERATRLDGTPSLAYFYHGHTKALTNAIEDAQNSYMKGLEFNRNHYKCLVGLYEALMIQQRREDAYFVLRQITRHFPLNPKRFISVLRLAVTTGHYEDIEQYYRIFLELDEKSDELVKHTCAALITSGKSYLQKGDTDHAKGLFQMAGISAGGKVPFLTEIITTLVNAGFADEADKYLKRFPQHTRETIEYFTMDYLVMSKTMPLQVTLDQGRKLVQEGRFHPIVDKILMQTFLKAGMKENAIFLAQDACRRWPEQAREFLEILKTAKTG
jgi:tetratricopeptide (TPR) repeat protein